MKFVITENKIFDVIKKYLDSKDLKKMDTVTKLFFYQEGNFLADIALDYFDGWAELNFQLVDDIEKFFSINRETATRAIESWIEDKTGIGKVEAWAPKDYHRSSIFLPSEM